MEYALQTNERCREQYHAHALTRALDRRRAGPLRYRRHPPSLLLFSNGLCVSRSSDLVCGRVRCLLEDGRLHWTEARGTQGLIQLRY